MMGACCVQRRENDRQIMAVINWHVSINSTQRHYHQQEQQQQ